MPDWGWIVLVVAVVFGASKLPDIARNLGRSSGEFKKGLKEGNVGMDDAIAAPPPAAGVDPTAAAPPISSTPETDPRRPEAAP
jgi:sec-independent protein translocase protein TatA